MKFRKVVMMGVLAGIALPGFNLVSVRADWESTLAAAKKEGKVSVITDVTATLRDALTLEFQKKYGISVDLFGISGREVAPRVAAERKAGQFLWDIYIHGSTTALEAMIPMGAFDPLEPALILPDVKDPKTWRGGAIEFLDPSKMVMVMTPFQRGTIFYNTKLVNAKEFKSYKDLLDPKVDGKDSGGRSAQGRTRACDFHFLLSSSGAGPGFHSRAGQATVDDFRDYAQEVDAVGQGRYPVLIGTADFVAINRAKQGVPIAIVDARQLKEGTDLSPTNGNLALFNRAPNPNAAKVYINWLLSKEGQTIFARANGYVSARLDVPTDHTEPWRVPLPGAIKTYTKAAMQVKDNLQPLLQEVFGSQ